MGLPPIGWDEDQFHAAWLWLAESCGKSLLTVAWGEPMSNKSVIGIMANLARRHRIHVNTNLVAPLGAWDLMPRNGNVGACLSFHPHRFGISEFIERKNRLRDSGIAIQCTGVVAWPPFLKTMPEWLDKLRADDPTVGAHMLAFWGQFDGKSYPAFYTDEERSWFADDISSTWGKDRYLETTTGKLCRAGRDYMLVRWDGQVGRCVWGGPSIGSMIDRSVKRLTEPAPCFAATCGCPDMWEYIEEAPPDA
jgi:hypothetical protein